MWGIRILFPIGIPKVYHQTVGYYQKISDPQPDLWATLTHTLIILNDTAIDSIINVTAVMDPSSLHLPQVCIEISFNNLTTHILAPRIVGGNQSWTGQMHENETKIQRTTLMFDQGDGIYHIAGRASAFDSKGSTMGFVTNYYIKVQGEKIVKVMDPQEWVRETGNTEMEAVQLNVPVNVACTWASNNSYVDIKLTNFETPNLTIRGVGGVWPEIAITSNATETTLNHGETVIFRVTGSFAHGTKYTFWIPYSTNGEVFTFNFDTTPP